MGQFISLLFQARACCFNVEESAGVSIHGDLDLVYRAFASLG